VRRGDCVQAYVRQAAEPQLSACLCQPTNNTPLSRLVPVLGVGGQECNSSSLVLSRAERRAIHSSRLALPGKHPGCHVLIKDRNVA